MIKRADIGIVTASGLNSRLSRMNSARTGRTVLWKDQGALSQTSSQVAVMQFSDKTELREISQIGPPLSACADLSTGGNPQPSENAARL